MKLYVHRVDPHYSHDFADLYFEGSKFCLTERKGRPITQLEMVGTFDTRREAERVRSATAEAAKEAADVILSAVSQERVDRAAVIEGGPEDDWEERGAADELRRDLIEECAKVAEGTAPIAAGNFFAGRRDQCKKIAAAIRALANAKGDGE